MSNFKSNASRKRFLSHKNKRKYAVGGLTPSTSMYGNNEIPYTSSIVYGESDPAKQEEYATELKKVGEDTSYETDAMNVLNRQDQIEGYGLKAGKMGINKLADMAPDDYVGPNMGETPMSALRLGAEAFKKTRTLNRAYKGVATGKEVAKNITSAADLVGDAGALTNWGNEAARSGSALSAGGGALKSGLGVGTVGALMAAGGDKLYDNVTNDQTLEGRADFTGKEAGASALRGAGAGIGAVSTGAALGTMLGVGAANAWNPIGWATLAAAGIGAGVTALNRKRKARKAGEELNRVEGDRDADIAGIKRKQRFNDLESKQYSGFDYGGDNQNPGFYGKTGGVKYQTEGVRGLGSSILNPNTASSTSLTRPDVLAKPEGFQNPYTYNPSYMNDDIIAQNKISMGTPENARYVSPYISTMEPDSEIFQSIQQNQGGYPIGEAEVVAGFVPQDIPAGYDPYENNSMEQKIYDSNKSTVNPDAAMNAVLEYRQSRSNIHSATAPVGNVASTALAGGAALQSGAFNAPLLKYGTSMLNNAKNAYTGINAAGNVISTGARVTSGVKAAIAGTSLYQLPDKASGIGSGLLQETSKEGGNAESRLRVGANLTSFLPGFKQLKATLGSSGPSVKDVLKITKDIEGGYYGNAMMRTGLSFLKGDQNRLLDKINPEAVDAATSGLHLGGKQGWFKNFLNYSDNTPSSTLGTPATEMREGGVRNLPGGKAVDIGNGATKYVGQTHEQGGIMADPQSEIENNEIEKDVTLADGSKNPYIFSEYLNTDGSKGYNDGKESIASVAEGLVASGAPQPAFDKLAIEQELKANRDGTKIMNTTMAKYGGYRHKGIRKYQTDGLTDTPLPDESTTNIATPSILQNIQTPGVGMNTPSSGYKNSFGLSGDLKNRIANINYTRRFNSGNSAGLDLNYNPNSVSAGVNTNLGNRGNLSFTGTRSLPNAGAEDPFGGSPFDTQPASDNPMSYKVSGRWNFRQGGLKPAQYQSGGATSYQQQGLMINPDQPRNYYDDTYYQPPVYDGSTEGRMGWWITPDGARHSEEADAVEHINSGKMDSYNPDAASSYMPSDDTMADISAGEAVDRMTQFPTNNNPLVDNDRNNVPDYIQVNPVSPPSPNSGSGGSSGRGSGGSGGGGGGGSSSYTSPFSNNDEEKEFQDWVNSKGGNTGGYGWGKLSQDAWNSYGDRYEEEMANRNFVKMESLPAPNNDHLVNPGILLSDEDSAGGPGGGGSAGGDDGGGNGGRVKSKGRQKFDNAVKSGSLLKAAQFIPAAMAFMDKPDYLKEPNKIGGVPRINLENVSFNDRQATINADNAAMQKFISNSGAGTAGFAARMAGWQKKEELSAAVTAEQSRTNNQINNQEAQMNAEVEARNRMIQSENRAASMRVDQFNTESEAATKAQRFDAVANATSGLMTQWMDQKKLDATDRLGRAIEGQTKVLDNEEFRNQTDAYIADNNLDITDKTSAEYYDIYDMIAGTEKETKQFGGMRKIPRYGYSTK